MHVKVGNYVFKLNKESDNAYVIDICTSDNVVIVSLKLSHTHILMLIGLINNIALDIESGFINLPLSNIRFKHTIYLNRNNYKGEIYMKVYKTDMFTACDVPIVSVTSKIESREFEHLYRHLNNLLG